MPSFRPPSGDRQRPAHLGDFAVTGRLFVMAGWALPAGAASALASTGLLHLIGLITNLVFYQRVGTALVAPGLVHHSPLLVLGAPIAGGLVIGLMARYGSEKIRGHGMPEAIEAILTGGSRVAPRVAVLKPVSAAISIGTGGPFGAEGPIIMTGGAIGSLLAQTLRLSADERKTLLVAGAAGGMAATFNAPMASVLLAVELLLFEWRPRSFVPVTVAVSASTILRGYLLGTAPVFPVPAAGLHVSPAASVLCLAIGLTGGLLAVGATALVYLAEDAFSRLPLHWMWWPAIGGAVIGLGGLIEPRALGVGYDVIDQLLTGRAALSLIIGILTVKTLMWSLSLGSGTSGGVLAPVFMIGAALGALEGHWLPAVAPGFWAMMGLAAVVGGVMRSPLTGVVFTLELTHAWPAALALLIASTAAYALSVVILRRSILTEKVARRGLHLTREYSTDPLEAFFAEQVMSPPVVVLDPADTIRSARERLAGAPDTGGGPGFYPVAHPDGGLAGVLAHADLVADPPGDPAPGGRATGERTTGGRATGGPATGDPAGGRATDAPAAGGDTVARRMRPAPAVVHTDDTLRHVAYVFAETGLTEAPVVDRRAPHRLAGIISLSDLLHARLHDHTEEHHRQRILTPPARGRSQRPHQSGVPAPGEAGIGPGGGPRPGTGGGYRRRARRWSRTAR